MIDVKQTDDGDIDITGGTLTFVSGADYVAQKMRQRARMLQGEWALDTSLGFPWLQEVLGKRITPERLDSLMRQMLLTILEVKAVNQLTVSVLDANRSFDVQYEVVTTGGEIISGGIPFVLQ